MKTYAFYIFSTATLLGFLGGCRSDDATIEWTKDVPTQCVSVQGRATPDPCTAKLEARIHLKKNRNIGASDAASIKGATLAIRFEVPAILLLDTDIDLDAEANKGHIYYDTYAPKHFEAELGDDAVIMSPVFTYICDIDPDAITVIKNTWRGDDLAQEGYAPCKDSELGVLFELTTTRPSDDGETPIPSQITKLVLGHAKPLHGAAQGQTEFTYLMEIAEPIWLD